MIKAVIFGTLVRTSLDAGMSIVAVSTPLTRGRLHETDLHLPGHTVDDPDTPGQVIEHILNHAPGK